VILKHRSVATIMAGELRNRHTDPLNLCEKFRERFGHWLRSGKPQQANHQARQETRPVDWRTDRRKPPGPYKPVWPGRRREKVDT
jgi:hypothetical protein